MRTTKTTIQVRRIGVVPDNSFEEVVQTLTATIGHPDMNSFHKAVMVATTIDTLEEVVRGAIGSSELMEFMRFDAGAFQTISHFKMTTSGIN